MKNKKIPYLLVFLQLSGIFSILISAPVMCENDVLLALEFLGVLLGLIAIRTMRRGNFNIAPIPKPKGELRTNGVYKIVRHPMYLASIIALFPLIIDFYSLIRLLLFVALLIILIVKLNFEEGLLIKQFPEYEEYKKTSWRLIPFIY